MESNGLILKLPYAPSRKTIPLGIDLHKINEGYTQYTTKKGVDLNPGQTIATPQCNVSQPSWLSICKLRPNDRNIVGRNMLHAFGHPVATCCELKIELVRMPRRNIVGRTWPNYYNIMQHPQMLHEKFDHFQIWADNTQHVATHRNMVAKRTQHVAPNNVTICCVEMLRSFGLGLMPLFDFGVFQSE